MHRIASSAGVLVTLGVCWTGNAQAQSAIDWATLNKALRDGEAACATFSVDCEFESQIRPLKNPAALLNARSTMRVTMDARGRIRCDRVGDIVQDTNKPRTAPIKSRLAFDGQACRSMEGLADSNARYSYGRVTAAPEAAFTINPRDFLYHYQGRSLAESLDEYAPVQWVEDVHIAGRRVSAFSTKQVRDADLKGMRWITVWVDPGRAFCVVKKVMYCQFFGQNEPQEQYKLECADFRPIGSGIWAPHQAIEETHSINKSRPPVLQSRHVVRLSNWRLYQSVPDSTFALSFPAGVMVSDHVTGRTFRVQKVGEEDLTEQVNAARALLADSERSARVRRAIAVGELALLMVLSIVVAITVIRRILRARAADHQERAV